MFKYMKLLTILVYYIICIEYIDKYYKKEEYDCVQQKTLIFSKKLYYNSDDNH